MQYRNAELHNVVELIDGGSDEVITPEAWDWLGEPGSAEWRLTTEQAGSGQWITRVPDRTRRGLNVAAQLNALVLGNLCAARLLLREDRRSVATRDGGSDLDLEGLIQECSTFLAHDFPALASRFILADISRMTVPHHWVRSCR